MTYVPHPAGGPDVDVLADVSAHLLPAADDRSARAHIEGCEDCTRVMEALARTGAELRWLPPLPMPDDVVSRIESALAEESKVASISQLRERRKRRRQLLGVAAAGLLVFGGGGTLVYQLGGNSPDSNVSADGSKDGEASAPFDPPDLDSDTLPGAVTELVTGGAGDLPLRLDGRPAPQDCVPGLQIEGVEELIGVIEIRYAGRDSDAVFFTTSDPAVARVFVVDDCSLPDPAIIDILQGQI